MHLQRAANWLVEEFMLLANMTTARMVAEAFPDRCAAAAASSPVGTNASLSAKLRGEGLRLAVPMVCL
jgi:exoribonuclease R